MKGDGKQISWGIGRFVVEQLSDAAHLKRVRWLCSWSGKVRWEWTEIASSLCDDQVLEGVMDQPRDFPNLPSLCDEQVLDSLMDQPRDFPNLGADIATMLSWFVKWEDDMEALKERLQVGEINDLYAILSAGKVLVKRNFQQTGDANLDGVLKAMELVLQSLQKNALQLESAICSGTRDELFEALGEAARLGFPRRGALYERAKAMLEAQLQADLVRIELFDVQIQEEIDEIEQLSER